MLPGEQAALKLLSLKPESSHGSFCICFLQSLYFLDSRAWLVPQNLRRPPVLLFFHRFLSSSAVSCFLLVLLLAPWALAAAAAEEAKHLLLLPSSHGLKAAGRKHRLVLTLDQYRRYLPPNFRAVGSHQCDGSIRTVTVSGRGNKDGGG